MPISDKEYIADLGECMTKLEADLAALREENARLTEKLAWCVEALNYGLLFTSSWSDIQTHNWRNEVRAALAAAKGGE